MLLLVSLLAGCASTPEWPVPGTDQPSTPDPVVLEDVPFYPQERYQCGPASLAMMLNSQVMQGEMEDMFDMTDDLMGDMDQQGFEEADFEVEEKKEE